MTSAERTPPTAAITWDGLSGTLSLDGHDISRAVQSATLTLRPNSLAELDLDVAVMAVEVGHVLHPRVNLFMPDEARALLISQGWTPPPGEDA